MTRERLQAVPREELAALAASFGVESVDSLDQAELIDSVLENYAEIRKEREQENNLNVRVEETKYEVSEDEARLGACDDSCSIPSRYNETRVMLMVRDPHWAYAYWDIEDQKAQRVKKDPNFEQLILRVHDLQPGTMFDIPIQWSDSSWYIYLPSPDFTYQLELGWISASRFKSLARSNEIRTPRETYTERSEEEDPEAAELFLRLGVAALDSPSSGLLSSEAIPQRILSTMRD